VADSRADFYHDLTFIWRKGWSVVEHYGDSVISLSLCNVLRCKPANDSLSLSHRP
jgi:hypothetical protein